MTPEVTVLALAGLLQVAQFSWMIVRANKQLGHGKTFSPRDKDRLGGSLDDLLEPRTARLNRAFHNHNEALILFTIAVVVVTLGDAANAFTFLCAGLYLIARTLYVPAYFFGWVPWRSYIWFTGFLASIAMIVAALLA